MKIAVLIGTRPGIVKMAPIIHELNNRGVDNMVIHTGQHYSPEMDRLIMRDVGLSDPDVHITRPENCISHAEQLAYMLVNIEKALLESAPDVLLVCGDANTNLAGALAARKIHISVGHVESGLRSFDWRMPEEHNRVMIDHISDFLFATTPLAYQHLIDDGVQGKVFLVGNTIVDATLRGVVLSNERGLNTNKFVVPEHEYCLLTLHREENVDNCEILTRILSAVGKLTVDCNAKFLFPVHPRTQKRLKEFGLLSLLEENPNINLVHPFEYLDFISVLKNAALVMTDSGGIQEESCILQTPCITLRESTERQETVTIGANIVVGTDLNGIVAAYHKVSLNKQNDPWSNPYGDGKTAQRIVDTCLFGAPKDEWR
jgi:UDP-N-acetylglucosamine 2-epimerase (non-hydrolysing)